MALELPFGIRQINPGPLDLWYGPYEDTTEANATVPEALRPSRTVLIDGVEYWWKEGVADEDLEIKITPIDDTQFWKTSGTTSVFGEVIIDAGSGGTIDIQSVDSSNPDIKVKLQIGSSEGTGRYGELSHVYTDTNGLFFGKSFTESAGVTQTLHGLISYQGTSFPSGLGSIFQLTSAGYMSAQETGYSKAYIRTDMAPSVDLVINNQSSNEMWARLESYDLNSARYGKFRTNVPVVVGNYSSSTRPTYMDDLSGGIIWNTTDGYLEVFDGLDWQPIPMGGTSGWLTDADTYVTTSVTIYGNYETLTFDEWDSFNFDLIGSTTGSNAAFIVHSPNGGSNAHGSGNVISLGTGDEVSTSGNNRSTGIYIYPNKNTGLAQLYIDAEYGSNASMPSGTPAGIHFRIGNINEIYGYIDYQVYNDGDNNHVELRLNSNTELIYEHAVAPSSLKYMLVIDDAGYVTSEPLPTGTISFGDEGTVPVVNSTEDGFDYTAYILPLSDGSAGQVLQTDGSGTVTWETVSGGTVTSVGLSVPTGFSVSGSPVTSSGTLALSFDTGYSLPTDTDQSNWDTAYGWGNHASAGYATTIYVDGHLAGEDLAAPTGTEDGQSIRWNETAGEWEYFSPGVDAESIWGVDIDSDAASPSDGDILVYRSASTSWVLEEKPTGGGGGITNGAASNELMKSNGTNAVASGIFSSTAGDITLGTGLSGNRRTITAAGSADDVGITIKSKGTQELIIETDPLGIIWLKTPGVIRIGDSDINSSNIRFDAASALSDANIQLNPKGDGIVEIYEAPLKIGEYILPATDGTAGQVLQTDGSGTVTWETVSGGGSPDWGDIGGTLSDQTDLKNALDAKADLAGATFTGKVNFTANATYAGLNMGSHSASPSSQAAGDIWTDTSNGRFMYRSTANTDQVIGRFNTTSIAATRIPILGDNTGRMYTEVGFTYTTTGGGTLNTPNLSVSTGATLPAATLIGTDPGEDAIMFWDDSDSQIKYLGIGAGLEISGGDLVVTSGGTGTVTSVGLSVPTGFTVSGSPVTTSGTLAISFDTGYQGYTTTEASKLSGIESGADVTDATNVAAAGAIMDGDFSANGVMIRTASGTYTSRTITAGTGISVNNGTGVSGNPTIALSHLGIQSLSDPGADRIMFFDDSDGAVEWLELGTNLSISGNTLNASGGGITNSAGNLELMMSDGTNAVGSTIYVDGTNIYLGGTGTSGSFRDIKARGSGSNIALSLQAKGTGGIEFWTNSIVAGYFDSNRNLGLFTNATNIFGTSAQGVIGLSNATAAPSGNPTDAVAVYAADISSSSVLHIRNEAGQIIKLYQPNAGSAYTITNGATDRTFDAHNYTMDELADVLATLIADLKTIGLIA